MSHWRQTTSRAETLRGTELDDVAYITGWSISGLAVLSVIVTVWVFGI
jgi:hypothetical protein